MERWPCLDPLNIEYLQEIVLGGKLRILLGRMISGLKALTALKGMSGAFLAAFDLRQLDCLQGEEGESSSPVALIQYYRDAGTLTWVDAGQSSFLGKLGAMLSDAPPVVSSKSFSHFNYLTLLAYALISAGRIPMFIVFLDPLSMDHLPVLSDHEAQLPALVLGLRTKDACPQRLREQLVRGVVAVDKVADLLVCHAHALLGS